MRWLLLALVLAGCSANPQHRSLHDDRLVVRPPDAEDVQEAVDAMGTDIARLYKGRWPSRFAVSRDFPDQPLVVVLRTDDRGRTKADTAHLDDLLEQALREQGYLRLFVDEVAVPPSLREDYTPGLGEDDGADTLDAGLELEPWIDRVGRFRLLLRDTTRDEPMLRSGSVEPEAVPRERR